MASLKRNFLWNAAFQVVKIITPLITTPYLARVLGSQALGTYSYTYTVANYAQLFILLGLNQYGTREVARARVGKEGVSRTFWSIWAMQLVTGALVSVVYLLWAYLGSGGLRLYALIWVVWVAAEAFDVSWLFTGLEEFRVITLRNLAVRAAVVTGIFLMVRSEEDLWAYCLLQAGAFAVSAAMLWPMLRRRVSWCRPRLAEVLAHVRPNLALFAPVIAISCYTKLNQLVLGVVSDMSQVAFFDNADKIAVIPLALIQALGTVALPRMARLGAVGDHDAGRRIVSSTVRFGSLLAFGLLFGIAGVAPVFTPVFFGPGYEPCADIMPLLALIIPLAAWSNVVGVQWLIPHGRDREYMLSVAAGAAASVSVCLATARAFGAVGAAAATVAAEVAVTGAQLWFVHRELPVGEWVRGCVPFAAAGAAMFAAVRAIGIAMGETMGSLAVQVMTGATVYLLLCLTWAVAARDERLLSVLPPGIRGLFDR